MDRGLEKGAGNHRRVSRSGDDSSRNEPRGITAGSKGLKNKDRGSTRTYSFSSKKTSQKHTESVSDSKAVGQSTGQKGTVPNTGASAFFSRVAGILVLLSVLAVMGLWIAGNPVLGKTEKPGNPVRHDGQVVPESSLPVAIDPALAENTRTENVKSPVAGIRKPVQSVTIATWNVRDCAIVDKKTGQRTNFHDSIARVVKNAGIDIIVFEEIQSDSEPGGDMTALAFALSKAGWTMPYTTFLETGTQDDIAIFSRYRIDSRETIVDPGKINKWPRPALLARINVKGREISVIGLHLKAMSDAASLEKRRLQALALADYLRDRISEKDYFVVAGDMNTTSVGDRLSVGDGPEAGLGKTTLGYLQVRDDSDTANDLFAVNEYLLPGNPTYDVGANRNILDHILLSKAAKVAYSTGSVAVYNSDPEVDMRSVSDHFPVLLKLDIPLSGE